jgi:threonine/homoserine/homoserine lactone efflux protein
MIGQAFFPGGPWQSWLTLVLEAVAVMGSPGPSTMAVTATGAAYGVRRSLGFASGAIVGTVAVLLAVAGGAVALLMSAPGLGSALTIASAVYILYLAWKIATAPPLSKRDGNDLAPSFASGFLLAIANPKAWFAIAAVFTGSTLVASSREWDASLKAAVLAVLIALIHFCWLFGGAALTGLLSDPTRSRVVNILFGLILAGTTVRALMR